MNGILFYNSFAFHVYSYKKVKHTDNSAGIPNRFFGRLRKGSARIVTQDQTLALYPGDLFYLPHGLSYHSYWIPDEESGVVEWESYRFEIIPAERNRCFHLQKVDAGEEALACLERIAKDRPATAADIGYFYAFLGEVMPNMTEVCTDARRGLFEKAEDYISGHPDLKVSELAKAMGMSESGLYAFFKSYAGTSPIKVKNKIQAERAIPLLTFTDLSIEEISDRLGFQSVAYFRKIMRDHFGKTPSEIRDERRSSDVI